MVGWLAAFAPRANGSQVPTAPEQFSADRAREVLGRLLGDERPHPVGSAANREVRARIERELTALGLSPRVQSRVSCGVYGLCARVENVLVELEGKTRAPGVALAAHYDSVPAGPAAADDGAGVASLIELARALRSGPPLERSVWLWLTDGEEMGLLGARALVAEGALPGDCDVVVNLEARGVSGPSLMYESSTPNDRLIESFGRAVENPVAGSTFYAVYERLPNDTDLSVFKRAGLRGLNLAFIDGTEHYHTPSDDLAHLSTRSVQHQGEQALALVRNLAGGPTPVSHEDAVFFDLFGAVFAATSASVARVATTLLVLVGGSLWAFAVTRPGRSPTRVAVSGARLLAAWGLCAVAALPLHAVAHYAGLLDQPWPASAWVLLCGVHLIAAAVVTLVVGGSPRDPESMFLGLWALDLVLAGALAWWLPEAAPLFALPALAATLGALGWLYAVKRLRREPNVAWAALPALWVTAVLWAPIDLLAYDALGVLAPSLNAAVAAVLLLPFAPFAVAHAPRGWRRFTLGLGVLAVVVSGLASALPSRSEDARARVNLAHHFDATRNESRYLLEAARVPPELRDVVMFHANADDPFPWFGATLTAGFRAPAPLLPRAAPEVALLREELTPLGRRLELLVTPSAEGALAVSLGLPAARFIASSIHEVSATPARSFDLAVLGMVSPEGPTPFFVEVRGAEPVPFTVLETRAGLPGVAAALVRARDVLSTASQTGDVTLTSRDVSL